MNSFRPFARAGNTIFKPALHLLDLGVDKKKADASPHRQRHRRQPSASSLDDTDHSDIEHYAAMDGTSSRASHSSRNSRSELQPPVPLIDLSRTPSPFSRTRSATQSDDDDDDLFEPASSIRPLVSHDAGRLRRLALPVAPRRPRRPRRLLFSPPGSAGRSGSACWCSGSAGAASACC